jgi:hypothetical protein
LLNRLDGEVGVPAVDRLEKRNLHLYPGFRRICRE